MSLTKWLVFFEYNWLNITSELSVWTLEIFSEIYLLRNKIKDDNYWALSWCNNGNVNIILDLYEIVNGSTLVEFQI